MQIKAKLDLIHKSYNKEHLREVVKDARRPLKCIKLIEPPRRTKLLAIIKVVLATQRFCHIMKRNCSDAENSE